LRDVRNPGQIRPLAGSINDNLPTADTSTEVIKSAAWQGNRTRGGSWRSGQYGYGRHSANTSRAARYLNTRAGICWLGNEHNHLGRHRASVCLCQVRRGAGKPAAQIRRSGWCAFSGIRRWAGCGMYRGPRSPQHWGHSAFGQTQCLEATASVRALSSNWCRRLSQ